MYDYSERKPQDSQAQYSTLHTWCVGQPVYVKNCMGKSPIVKNDISVIGYYEQ